MVSPSGTSTGTHVSPSQHWASPHSSLHHMSSPWSHHIITCHVSHSSPGTQGPGRTAQTQGWSWEANGGCTPLYEKISSVIIIVISRTCAALLRVPAVVAILETLPRVPPGLDLRFQTGEAEATVEKNEKIKQSRQHFNTLIHLLHTKMGITMGFTQCPDPDKGTDSNMSSLEHPTTYS